MTVAASTYGTVLGVERRIGWIVPMRRFSKDSIPDMDSVVEILDQIAAEIHMVLAQNGYPVDDKVDLDEKVAAILEKINEDGAADQVMIQNPYAIPDESNPVNYGTKYKAGLKALASGALAALGLSKTVEEGTRLRSGSYKTTDGDQKDPSFYRGQFTDPTGPIKIYK